MTILALIALAALVLAIVWGAVSCYCLTSTAIDVSTILCYLFVACFTVCSVALAIATLGVRVVIR